MIDKDDESDEEFKKLKKRRTLEWNELVKEGIKEEAQHKYFKEVESIK